MTGLTIAEKVAVPETVTVQGFQLVERDNGGSSRKSYRSLYLTVAIITGVVIVAGIILGGIYLGHTITRSSYQDAKLAYTNSDGSIVHEDVRVLENEVDFRSAADDFSVILDYNKMLTVIKTKIGSEESCYLTKLDTNQVGTFDDIKQRVANANTQDGGLMTHLPKEVQFTGTNMTVDATILSPRAATLCSDLPVVWMQAEPTVETGTANTGLEVRHKRRVAPGDGCKKDVVIIIIIIVKKPASKC